MENKVLFDVSWHSLWRVFIFFAIVLVFYFAREALGVLLVSIVISLGLDPIVGWLEERKINRLLGTLIVFFLGVLVLSAAVYLVVPIVMGELSGFLAHFNKVISSVFGFGLPKEFIKNVGLSLDRALGFLTATNISVTGAISTVVTKLILFLATILISFYLSVEKDGTERLLKVLLPDAYEKPVLTVFSRFKNKIRRWFAAQLALSLIVGAVVVFGLWLLGVRYFLILGLLAAIFEIVPIIGPVLSGAVIFMVAVSDSVSLGFYSILFAFIVQQLENHVLTPIIMGRAMKVHPVMVIVSLLAGAQVAGFLGILLSVPIAVTAQETFNYLAEKKSSKVRLGI